MNTLFEFAPMIIVEPMSNPVATVGSRGCVTKEKGINNLGLGIRKLFLRVWVLLRSETNSRSVTDY
jgi:hypothetical protein